MRARKFDWDDARERYGRGETITSIARAHNVSWTAVQRVLVPGRNEAMQRASRRWQAKGRCDECGGPMNNMSRAQGSRRCRRCAAAARATSVRPNELRCQACRQWKPDNEFPSHRGEPARRNRHTQCRGCLTLAKREWRARNRDRDNAYQREYRKRRRAKETA